MVSTETPDAPAAPLAYFKLKSAIDYRFYGRAGKRMLVLKNGEILPVAKPEDIKYFRARQDVLVETTHDGTPLTQLGLVNGFDKNQAKSFRVYGRQNTDAAPPSPPPTIPVGAAPEVAQPPVAPAQPVAHTPPPSMHTPSAKLPSETIPVGAAAVPGGMLTPGLPTTGPRFDARNPGYEAPLEELSTDGTTVVTGPSIDPGQ